MTQAAAQKILWAKTQLVFDLPFFAHIACHLDYVEDTNGRYGKTMCTDGKTIWYYPPFTESLSNDECLFVIVHEVLHVAYKHHLRRAGREPKRWNYATDYVINADLVDAKIGKMPAKGLHNPAYLGLHAEEVYRMLEDSGEGGAGDGDGEGEGGGAGMGGVIDGPSTGNASEMAAAEAEVDVMLKQAAILASKSIGTMPASLRRLIEGLLAPVVDWKSELRQFVDSLQASDYSWRHLNRRMHALGYKMPSLRSDCISHLLWIFDTSGSMQDPTLQRIGSEARAAWNDGLIDKLTVIYADATVNHVDTFHRGDELHFKLHGGGGTAFADTFDWIRENAPDASAALYFTDTFTSDWGRMPPMPVLWGILCPSTQYAELSKRPPFGRSVWVMEE